MSRLLMVDSFDHYASTQGARKWTIHNGGITTAGRTNSGLTAGPLSWPSKTFNEEFATLTMGVAYRTPGFANAIIKFTNTINGILFTLMHVGDGRLRFNFMNDLSPPSTYVMNADEWYYIEAQATIDGSPLHVVASARINGAEILTWDRTLGESRPGSKFATATFEGPGGGLQSTIDDVYITDTEFLGDVKIGVLYPNAAGDSTAWTPTPAGNNWQQVEEHPADDDTSYVSAATVGLKDLYNMDNIDPAFSGEIKGVQALWCVKKSDEGVGAVKGVWKSGSTEIVQASGHNYLAPNGFHPSAVNYLYNIQTERKSLFTAADWSASEVNSLQLGITRTL